MTISRPLDHTAGVSFGSALDLTGPQGPQGPPGGNTYITNQAGAMSQMFDVVSFGADPTGATYSDDAFEDALDAIRGLYSDSRGATLHCGGYFKLSHTLELNRNIVLQGSSGGGFWNSGAQLVFDDMAAAAIELEHSSTSDDGKDGSGSIIRNLAIIANNGSNVDGHAVHVKGHGCELNNVWIRGFGGNGIYITGGNANCWRIDHTRVDWCQGHGLETLGNDANAGVATLLDCSWNGKYGIYDHSFLGNIYLACHTELNGFQRYHQGNGNYLTGPTTTLDGAIDADDTTITVTDASNLLSTGGMISIDSENIWYRSKSGNQLLNCVRGYTYQSRLGSNPWNGTQAASHNSGATVTFKWSGYRSYGSQNRSEFSHCYCEGGHHAPSHIDAPGMVFGGDGDIVSRYDTAPKLGRSMDGYTLWPGMQAEGSWGAVTLGHGTGFSYDTPWTPEMVFGDRSGAHRVFVTHTADTKKFGFTVDSGGAFFEDARTPMQFVLEDNVDSFGVKGTYIPKLFFNNLGNSITFSNLGGNLPGWAGKEGDIVFDRQAEAGGKVGCLCTADGVNWKRFGAIDS